MIEIETKTNWTNEDVCFYANIDKEELRKMVATRKLTCSNPFGDENRLYFKREDVIAELQKKKRLSENAQRSKAVKILTQKMLAKHKRS